ncbi:MAG: PKD domain-containing protein, partial [Candidatus Omnitrophica bacterium]|nr:PKD domain-containing protein [Candidatus Omnitrophota bacterium]
MKKAGFLMILVLFLSGCASYRYHHGQPPYDKGYVVSRDDFTIVEYTLGENDSVPVRTLAKERFTRRRNTVEHYYKKMGLIENHFKMAVWDPATMFLKIVGGIFRLPFIAVSDYRYEHNPQYKEKMDRMEEEKEAKEEARVAQLKTELRAYVEKDLSREAPQAAVAPAVVLPKAGPAPGGAPEPEPEVTPQPVVLEKNSAVEPVAQEKVKPEVIAESAPQPAPAVKVDPKKAKEEARRQKLAKKERQQADKLMKAAEKEKQRQAKSLARTKAESIRSGKSTQAIIIAKPDKGYSPLRVRFYGNKSFSKKARIIAYEWDFGDGDISKSPNPINTFYSGSFEPKIFQVKLTIWDNKG